MLKLSYKHTVAACLIGSASQAIICNFQPLLFLTFSRQYGIPLGQITLIITVNFAVQLLTDLVASVFADKIGYRPCLVFAHVMCALGLVSMATLPDLLGGISGFLISAAVCGVGGGLIEVMVSPEIEACPLKNKSAMMSFLHSCYCWGVVLTVLVSSLFFLGFGTDNWKIMSFIWAAVPLLNALYFCIVPIYSLPKKEEINEKGRSRSAFSFGIFWVFLIMMLCSGASEQAVHQWSSTFAEATIGVDKSVGDLIGVCGFAVMMGVSRLIYANLGHKFPKKIFLACCSFMTIVSYFLVIFSPTPAVGLVGCILCGLFVGLFWPATLSLASENLPVSGTMTFALLAFTGDIGCTSGPTLVGFVSDAAGGNFSLGIAAALVFPITLFISVLLVKLKRSSHGGQSESASGMPDKSAV